LNCGRDRYGSGCTENFIHGVKESGDVDWFREIIARARRKEFLYLGSGRICDEKATLRKGDVLLIPAGVKHRFTNRSDKSAVTFNVYAPPEYPADSKG
jgi:uncharacterized protein YjlB